MKQHGVALPARLFRQPARELSRKTPVTRKDRGHRFRPAGLNLLDERTPIKLRPQRKEISLENSPRSTKTVEDGRRINAQVQWEGLRLKSRMNQKTGAKAVIVVSGVAAKC